MNKENNKLWDSWWRGKSLKKQIIHFAKEKYFDKYFSRLPLRYGKAASSKDVFLEAGCGEAGSSGYIKSWLSCQTIGVDLSQEISVAARKSCDYFVCGNLFSLPFQNKSIDVVFNQGVIEHFSDDQIEIIFKEIRRVCRKKIVICVPAATSIFRFIYNPFKELEGRFMSRRKILSLLEKDFRNADARYLLGSGFLSLVAWAEI